MVPKRFGEYVLGRELEQTEEDDTSVTARDSEGRGRRGRGRRGRGCGGRGRRGCGCGGHGIGGKENAATSIVVCPTVLVLRTKIKIGGESVRLTCLYLRAGRDTS